MTSTPATITRKRREDDLIEFDRRHAANIAEFARRLESVRAQPDNIKGCAKK